MYSRFSMVPHLRKLLEQAPHVCHGLDLGIPSSSLGILKKIPGLVWVAVKELILSYYIGETLLFTIYTHYGNLI